jgi:hypothetical protein
MPAKAVAAGRGGGPHDRVGDKDRALETLGPEQRLERLRVEMDAVGDEARPKPILGELREDRRC